MNFYGSLLHSLSMCWMVNYFARTFKQNFSFSSVQIDWGHNFDELNTLLAMQVAKLAFFISLQGKMSFLGCFHFYYKNFLLIDTSRILTKIFVFSC